MNWLPGWQDPACVSLLFKVFQWIAIITPVVAGALAFVYGERRQELSDVDTSTKIQEVEKKYAPRRLTSEQRVTLIEGIRSIGQSRTVILVRLMDQEGATLGQDFFEVFSAAGWGAEVLKTALSNEAGIRIVLEDAQYRPLANQLARVLNSAGLEISPNLSPRETGAAVKPFREVGIGVGLYIGPKI